MAKPIKETPVLTGEDARHFETWMTENEGKKSVMMSMNSYVPFIKALKSFITDLN